MSPTSWSSAGHCAIVIGPREEREKRDDKWGRLISERAGEGERARAGRTAWLYWAERGRARVHARLGRVFGWDERGEEERG
jgi:hypothetical protein